MCSLCELSPGEPLTVIDQELILNDMDGMDNLDMPIIDEDGLDKAYEMEYEVCIYYANNVGLSFLLFNSVSLCSVCAHPLKMNWEEESYNVETIWGK